MTVPYSESKQYSKQRILCIGANYFYSALVLLWVVLLINPIHANALEINSHQQKYKLGPHLQYLIDQRSEYTIEQIQSNALDYLFIQSEIDTPYFGYSSATYWIKFELTHASSTAASSIPPKNSADAKNSASNWLLELQYPTFREAILFQPIPGNPGKLEKTTLGISTEHVLWGIKVSPPLYELKLKHNTPTVYYLRLRSSQSIQIPLILWSPKRYIEAIALEKSMWGIFYGILVFAVGYNLFVFISVRKASYFYYILYVISVIMLQSSRNGVAHQYLWGNNNWWAEISTTFFIGLTVLFMVLFTKEFLSTKNHSPYSNTSLIILVVLSILIMLGAIFASPMEGLVFAVCIVFFVSTTILSVSINCVIRKVRAAKWFLIAWTFLLIGIAAIAFREIGALAPHWSINYATEIGVLLETILLSLGLADLINTERKARYEALNRQHQTMIGFQKAQNVLVYQATHDASTNLPNSALFESNLNKTLTASNHQDDLIAVFIIYLSRFNEIINTLGKHKSDKVLQNASERLCNFSENYLNVNSINSAEGSSPLALIENNTFALSINIRTPDHAAHVAKGLRDELARPFIFDDLTFDVDTSLGVSLYPNHSENVDDLIHKAHIAVDVAKDSEDHFAIYSSKVDPYSEKRLTLMADLREAIAYNGVDLYFHPLVDIKSENTVGAEALIRWNHPVHGFISPDEFIPLAEQTGVITPLTEWVLEQAMKQILALKSDCIDISISVNISAQNLREANFYPHLLQRLQHNGVPTHSLILEVTETAMMKDPVQALAILEKLNQAGITLAIDDFGTGYSSMAYLKSLPAKEIKVDRSFVSNMVEDKDDAVIVETIINMSHIFGLQVVAEGIEDRDTLKALRDLGCDTAQGFLFTKPLPKKEFEIWLSDSPWGYRGDPLQTHVSKGSGDPHLNN
ncbi:MAG: hypothetical protein COB51_03690 [Moraxellaceae bacterium]|nr:MAG: hypothetical protein COB51_03690 [Moraxellaceae bacterium]